MKKYPEAVLKTIKKNLILEKAKLTEQLKKLKQEDPFSDPERVNDNAASDTDAKEEVDHERIEALQIDIQDNLTAITAALERIKNGSYGFCKNCKKMIDTDRLNVNPTAKFCITCEKSNTKQP